MQEVGINDIRIGRGNPLVLIAGPCVIEGEKECFNTAKSLKEITSELGVPFIFKSSYDKANRTSIDSARGPGIKRGLKILKKIKEKLSLPILSDVHNMEEIKEAAAVLDVIQIPAFLCRQTDILIAAAKTKKIINVKKGQFLSPWDTRNIIKKIESVNNRKILLTERGVSFGYNNLVADMRSIPIMRRFGYPVVFDATHSVQLPGGAGSASGGEREFVSHLARAAVAVGCDAVFMEVHHNPDKALCDGPNMISLDELVPILRQLKEIDNLIRGFNLK